MVSGSYGKRGGVMLRNSPAGRSRPYPHFVRETLRGKGLLEGFCSVSRSG